MRHEGARIDLAGLTLEQLIELLEEWGVPAFRARQIYGWLFRSLASDSGEMRNLPAALRERLALSCRVRAASACAETVSRDGLTRKVLLELADGELVESVLMLYPERATVCVSSQVGCAIGCPFCATGQSGLERNLSAAEIVEQVLHYARSLKAEGRTVTNVVFMGMGEPLANYEAVWQAMRILNAPEGFGLGARHMTISTAGMVPEIRRLATAELQVGLAVSLHAADDALRDQLVPLNRGFPIAEVVEACDEYCERTGRRVSYEYALIAGVNDSPAQARELGRLLRGRLCHVNLIPLNATGGSLWRGSSGEVVRAFQRQLANTGVKATVRVERGREVEAACGQLRRRHLRGEG